MARYSLATRIEALLRVMVRRQRDIDYCTARQANNRAAMAQIKARSGPWTDAALRARLG